MVNPQDFDLDLYFWKIELFTYHAMINQVRRRVILIGFFIISLWARLAFKNIFFLAGGGGGQEKGENP